MAFRFECFEPENNHKRYYEIEIVDDPEKENNTMMLIRHCEIGQEAELKPYKVGTKEEIMEEIRVHVQRRQKHRYVPMDSGAENIADGIGWMDWREDKATRYPDQSKPASWATNTGQTTQSP